MISKDYTLGIDVGSTTVKVALLDPEHELIFADYISTINKNIPEYGDYKSCGRCTLSSLYLLPHNGSGSHIGHKDEIGKVLNMD